MDPMERILADAFDLAGMEYLSDYEGENPSNLDFRLHNGIEIEVKRMHSPRIAEQMSRAENVIAVQGKDAVEYLAGLVTLTRKLVIAREALDRVANARTAMDGGSISENRRIARQALAQIEGED